jgi:hypothetical protein
MLLLCAGAVASLAAVWTLAGLSESSSLRITPRVALATLVGLGGTALVFMRAPSGLRSELALPLLFGVASLLALAAGAAKIDAALADKDGARVVRRASGIVVGTVLGMAAVGAASLDLSSSSLVHARFGWGFMFAFIASVLIIFGGRARYAGAGLVALGQRALMLGLVAVALLAGARLTVAAPSRPATTPNAPLAPAAAAPLAAEAVSAPAVLASSPTAADSSAPRPDAAVSAPSAPSAVPSAQPAAPSGQIEIGEITTRGLLEADARGGVTRRLDRLQECLANPKNDQHGTLMLKIGIDASGSPSFVRATDGELKGTPLGDCLLRVFYKMGYAAPSANNAGFNVTLRIP